MGASARRELPRRIVVPEREFDGPKARPRRHGEAIDERDLVAQEREIGGETRHHGLATGRRRMLPARRSARNSHGGWQAIARYARSTVFWYRSPNAPSGS